MKLLSLRLPLNGARSHAKADAQQNGSAPSVHAESAHEPGHAHTSEHPGRSASQMHSDAIEDVGSTAEPPAVELLDLPPALLQEIFAHAGPGTSRTGAALPFVCRAFRAALSDCRHERMWERVDAELCRSRNGIQWPGLRKWLNARAAAIRHLVLP